MSIGMLSKKLKDAGCGMLVHWCDGCGCRHYIDTKDPNGAGDVWQWNGDAEKPTFTPSINIVGRCHYFIRDGLVEFMMDSNHHLAGNTVPLPDFPVNFTR